MRDPQRDGDAPDERELAARTERELEEGLFGGRMTRRRFGRGAGMALMAGGMASALSACGIAGTAQQNLEALQAEAETTRHPKVPIRNWTFSNWPLYVDKSVLKDFDRKYGGKVRYVEDISDNADFYGKVRQQLAQKQPIGRDIVVLTDFMCSRWVRNGYVTPIDKTNIPNLRNLEPGLRTINYDPQRQFTVPYQSGAVGMGYDIKKTGRELKSLKELFSPEWKGQVSMLSDPYDSATTVLVMQGKDPSTATLDDMLAAIELLQKYKDKGQFRRFTGNDYTTDLTKGNVAIALSYSGDLVQLQSDNPNLRFSYAEEGSSFFTDNCMLPALVQHPYAAEKMMDYLYEPEVAAKVAAYVNYISPVAGIREILLEDEPEIAKNELIFPPEAEKKKFFKDPQLSSPQEQEMLQAMARVTGA